MPPNLTQAVGNTPLEVGFHAHQLSLGYFEYYGGRRITGMCSFFTSSTKDVLLSPVLWAQALQESGWPLYLLVA